MAKGAHQFDVHHRKPRSHGGNDDDFNTIKVNKKKHAAFHQLFASKTHGTMYPQEIASELNTKWTDPKVVFVVMTAEEHNTWLLSLAKEEIYKQT